MWVDAQEKGLYSGKWIEKSKMKDKKINKNGLKWRDIDALVSVTIRRKEALR